MQYELVMVVDPKLDEKQATEKFTNLLTKEGFVISGLTFWGKKDLAYPIKKQTQGSYLSCVITGDKNPTLLSEKFRLDEAILRTLVLRKEEKKKISKS